MSMKSIHTDQIGGIKGRQQLIIQTNSYGNIGKISISVLKNEKNIELSLAID